MRTLETHLDTALDAGNDPYMQLQYCVDGGFTWLDAPYSLTYYKLGDLELVVKSFGTALFDAYAIRLKRGAYYDQTAHSVTSSHYYVNKKFITDKQQVQIEATIIPKGTDDKYSTDGHQSYVTIIDAICAHYGYTTSYEDPTAVLWDNVFYPPGRTLVLQSPHHFFTLLRQKLLIYAQDNNDGEIYFRQLLDDSVVGTGGHPSLETLTTFDYKEQYSIQQRTLMWRDEAATVNYYPRIDWFPNFPYYNLGYIESTDDHPTVYQSWHLNEDKYSYHLKYQDGDILTCTSGTYQVQVFELFDRKAHPSICLQFVALPKFTITEGGPLPSTMEASAPYTPLNTSHFSAILSSFDNNLQAAMETLDDHVHTGLGTGDVVGPLPSVHDHIVTYYGVTGKVIQDSGYLISDLSLAGHTHAGVYEPLIGVLESHHGGTGVNNAGTITNASNTTISGGGTLALGGFTLTVPATGSAALLAVANTFTASNIFAPSVDSTTGFVVKDKDANVILIVDTVSNLVGINTAPSYRLHVDGQTYQDYSVSSATTIYGAYFYTTNASTGSLVALFGRATANNVNGTCAGIYGMWYTASSRNASDANHMTVSAARGAYFLCEHRLTGSKNLTVGDAYSLLAAAPSITKTGAGTLSVGSAYGLTALNQGNAYTTTAYGLYIADQSGAGTNYSIYTNAGHIVLNAGGDASSDFTVKSDSYNAIFVDASNESVVLMSNAAGKVGFFAAAAVAQHAHIADASDAATVITTCNHILSVLEEYGLLASA